ncbi:hypothetical protein HPB47_001665 [Ixodes persulcatus]|uniref:Uncharacterized protein n=1 Tax=Ixodes persulcatus TaxID=34615 RepID=A0AC60PPJ8_IXOPE|nr:hypothetical protein HPB47_001665 [Ixodes persulcatus]
MRALVNRLNVGETSRYGAVKERVSLELELSRAEEDYRRELGKVKTYVGKTNGKNLNHQGQKRPDPSVHDAPQILLQPDDTKRSSKNNCSCVSVQTDVDDSNELNVSRSWSTSQLAEDDHDEQVNVDDERPYTLPGRQASRRSGDSPCVKFDSVEAEHGRRLQGKPRVSPGRRTFRQAEDDDEGQNLSPGRQAFLRAEDDDAKTWTTTKDRTYHLGGKRFGERRMTRTRTAADEKSGKAGTATRTPSLRWSSQNIARDTDEGSTTCQPATCERAGSAEDVDNGDRLRGPFLILRKRKNRDGSDGPFGLWPGGALRRCRKSFSTQQPHFLWNP